MAELDYEYLAGLVKKVQEGNSDAFAEIYAATYQKLYRFAYRYIRDEHLAQDILQEVYILVLKNIKKLRNPKLFVSWINQITFRICFNTTVKHKEQMNELGSSQNALVYSETDISKEETPEEAAELKATNEELIQQVLSLPPAESQAIIMKYYNDMKLEEIASAMNCSRSTVKRHLVQGRKKLELLLSEQKGGANNG